MATITRDTIAGNAASLRRVRALVKELRAEADECNLAAFRAETAGNVRGSATMAHRAQDLRTVADRIDAAIRGPQ